MDGQTLRETLEAVERMTRKPQAELDGPGLPAVGQYLWEWFQQLHGARPSTGFGVSAISHTEMAHFFSLIGVRPEPWEIGILRALDGVALTSVAPDPNAKARAERPASAAPKKATPRKR